MRISAREVQELRQETGAGMMDCKRALQAARGDNAEAIKILREKGLALAEKKASRAVREGLIGQYIHTGGKLGVLIEVNCETDFVARNPGFVALVKDLAMQVAASNPQYIRPADIPEEELNREREIYRNQAVAQGKPEPILDKIVEGKLKKYYAEVCLYEQFFIKNPDQTISDLVQSKVAEFGENIVVKKFARFKIGS